MPTDPAPPPDPAPTEVPWLSAEQQRDWRALVTMLMTLPGALDAQLRADSGFNLFEYHVLAALGEAPGRRLVMSDLAEMSRGSLSRLSHAVARLEREGLVVRSACSDGRRRMEATLTDAGWNRLVEAAPGHVREARRLVVDPLAGDQLAALAEAARVVVGAIDPGSECREYLRPGKVAQPGGSTHQGR
jgi:DNA-binding MarR family transcriptional regulator